MGTNFQYSKTLAMEGSILITLGLIPYVGWVLGIVGIVLLLRAMKEFANYYQDNSIYQNSLTGIKFYIVALIALAVAGAGFVVGFVFNGFANNGSLAAFGIGNALGLAVGVAFLVIACVFYVLAATHLRKTFDTLAQKTGEHSFVTAATLLWLGAWLTLIGVGVLLLFIAWIFAVIGFFTLKSPQQPYASQPYGYTSPPPPPSSGPTPIYCSNCGTPLKSQATYCSNCGKKVD